jgi:hypothetical protein
MTRIAYLTAAATALAAILSAPVLAEDGFARIHQNNQKIGSQVWSLWHQVAETAEAQADDLWQVKTANAYLSVYSYYCAPGFYGAVATDDPPSSMEIAIYSDIFRAEYASDCRAFYLSEIVTRLDPDRIDTVVLAGN